MKHSKGAPVFTESQIREHAAKAGVPLPTGLEIEALTGKKLQPYQKAILGLVKSRMNKTEAEFARLLDAEKRRGNATVVDYRFEGMTLMWGKDEETGKQMRYTADFFVRTFRPCDRHRLIEVKGAHIWSRDLVRFKGCRSEWQWLFDFELWQKKTGQWQRIQ